jgi:hypothetical protein
MTWSFYDRLNGLNNRMKRLNTRTIVITVDGEDVSVPASLGKTEIEELSPTVGIGIGSLRDYFINIADLKKADNTPFLPERGMTIVDGTITCSVSAEGAMPIFDYVTSSRTRIRLHTKVTGVA